MNPTLSWRKKIGPGEVMDINTATKKVAMANSGKAPQQNAMSIARFQSGSGDTSSAEDFIGSELTRSDAMAVDRQ